uniref:Phosphoinositide 3-kinase regulatory subunit 5 n=1 Tax=Eptatretus burgeri TaxID=7764 RepID=A0A8C4QT21_EPTBU
MFFLHTRNLGYYFFFRNIELSVAYTPPKQRYASEECVACLEQDRPSGGPLCGLALIRWSLEELSTREPSNALLLMEQILMKLQEVMSLCDRLTPLASRAVHYMPHIHGNNDVLQRAYCHFRKFLSLPNPMGYVCRDILSLIKAERRAPGMLSILEFCQDQGLTQNWHLLVE